jgi:peptide/nickel transport system ATP-binding protein
MNADLEVQALVVELEGDAGLVRAIDDLHLSLARGETFALVGESGCGKSMTALALMRLLPENGYVASGDIHLGQGDRRVDVLALPEAHMRGVRGARIGMIFQEPSTSLNPVMKVGQQVLEAVEAHTPLRGPAARAKAVEWLQRVGIPEPERRFDDYPFRMSGGQKQRVMIAMALAAEPDFLVADEPTTALDVTIQAQILALLKDLQRERGMGLLLITHDLAVVSGMADRVALMYAGQIIEVASAKDFFSRPLHPYASALLRALPSGQRRHEPLHAIAGTVPALNQRFAGCRFAPRCDRAMDACATTSPALMPVQAGREVRCLLFVPGAPATATSRQEGAASRLTVVAVDAPAPLQPATSLATDAPLLEVKNLCVRFPIRGGITQRVVGHFNAVDKVSFALHRGQTLALVGESGCGKTTTGKAVLQLLRRSATIEGQALLNGQDLFTLQGDALREARRQIQIIFQDPFASLNPRMRVHELLEEGLLALHPEWGPDERRQRLERLTEQCGLRSDALMRYPHEFSGGQRQRIAIARALAVEPQLIVCDEPTSALDVSVQAQILNLLRQLQRDLGVSYLFITHNMAVVECIADQVVVMRAGKVEEQGDCQTLFKRPRSAYTQELMAAVPRLVAAPG